MIDGLDESVATALLQPHILEEHLLLLIALQFGDVSLSLGADDEHLGILSLDGLGHGLGICVAGGSTGIVHITYVEHRLGCEQEHALGSCSFILRIKGDGAGTLSLEQSITVSLQHIQFHTGLLVTSHACSLLHLLHAALHSLQVLQLQFGIYYLLVPHGVYTSIHMHDVAIVETPEHMDDGITLTYVGQELVAQSFTLTGTFHQSCDVHDITHGWHYTPWMHQFGQLGKTLVGHRYLSQLGIYGTKGEVGRLCLGTGQAVEKGGLSHIGQSHYTCFHILSLLMCYFLQR